LALAFAAYNAGPVRVQLYGRRVHLFHETVSYVRRVKRTYDQRKSLGKAPKAANNLISTPTRAAIAREL
jgi:soluble lytic murein transglycosylase-like protein